MVKKVSDADEEVNLDCAHFIHHALHYCLSGATHHDIQIKEVIRVDR